MEETVYEVQVKNEDGTWSTSKMFHIGDIEEKEQYIQSLKEQGYEVSVSLNKVKTKAQLINDFLQLIEESSKAAYLTGENVIVNAWRGMT